ncbi:MAG: septum formation initiator family protein [Gemmatimonadales bacterium]
MTRGRWIALGGVVLALLFALEGGEYSTLQWLELRRSERDEAAEVVRLEREVDSLEKRLKLIQTDPAVQEQLARELYGMVRRGEHLFTLLGEPESP